jgi:predicted  nucleic acid-binding Zn ribbon protein
MHKKYQVAVSGENLHKVALNDQKQTINFLTQEVKKLQVSHKDTVDGLQLELSQAKAVSASMSQTRVQGEHNTTIAPADAVGRVLQQELAFPSSGILSVIKVLKLSPPV